jgi:anti-sigma regulatory factor (Ser/Thr protein kinase)
LRRFDGGKNNGDDGASVRSVALANDVGSVAAARHFVQAQVAEQGFDHDAAMLLTSELVANVIRHAHSDITVWVSTEPCLHVGVQDGAAATEAFREILFSTSTEVPVTARGGRGLPLVGLLASRFGLDDASEGGKIVWFELDAG